MIKGIYYVYLSEANKVIKKFLSYDNGLSENDYNNYGHKVILKVNVYDNQTLSDKEDRQLSYQRYYGRKKSRWYEKWKR
ncbi:MAG: hypothetical protein PHO63_02605 [Bacilli bacterium]|nr:hypothetical protein [Bacilli bacterium]MDD4809392.1 hypothetical protein [Bacilli bacterium]